MIDTPPESLAEVYAKSAIGLQELRTRHLRLGPALRRILVLADGQRTGRELAALIPGQDINPILDELLHHRCIEPLPGSAAAVPPASVAPAKPGLPTDMLSDLPPALSRSAEDIAKARNFMTNTVNVMFGQNMRLSLVEAIARCRTAEEVRGVYPNWVETMASERNAAKRLPELQRKLKEVL